MQYAVDPSYENNEAIIIASEEGHCEVVNLLLSDQRRETTALAGNTLVLLSPAYAYAVDPSEDFNYAIRMASENGHPEVVRCLLNYRADQRCETIAGNALVLPAYAVDPSDYTNYAIRFASANGHLKVMKLLLADKRVDPSSKNNCAIRWASKNGHYEVVKLLLATNSVDPSCKNNKAFRLASNNGHYKVVKLLLADQRGELKFRGVQSTP